MNALFIRTLAAALLISAATAAQATDINWQFQYDNPEEKDREAVGHQPLPNGAPTYDYSPAYLWDGEEGRYKAWWARGVAGDFIYYSERTPAGEWSEPLDVFVPDGHPAAFDSAQVNDPSIIKHNGTYYMYYGAGYVGSNSNHTTIGVATSSNGKAWVRRGQILQPYQDLEEYNAGHPSVVKVLDYFYLFYLDTTPDLGPFLPEPPYPGQVPNPYWRLNGQYVVRSRDPLFANSDANPTEQLTAPGSAHGANDATWERLGPEKRTIPKFMLTLGVNLDYSFVKVAESDRFVALTNRQVDGVHLQFFDWPSFLSADTCTGGGTLELYPAPGQLNSQTPEIAYTCRVTPHDSEWVNEGGALLRDGQGWAPATGTHRLVDYLFPRHDPRNACGNPIFCWDIREQRGAYLVKTP